MANYLRIGCEVPYLKRLHIIREGLFQLTALRPHKTAFQQGRSEREPEAYGSRYVEGLSEARTQLEDVFSGLLLQIFRLADTYQSPPPSSFLRQ